MFSDFSKLKTLNALKRGRGFFNAQLLNVLRKGEKIVTPDILMTFHSFPALSIPPPFLVAYL